MRGLAGELWDQIHGYASIVGLVLGPMLVSLVCPVVLLIEWGLLPVVRPDLVSPADAYMGWFWLCVAGTALSVAVHFMTVRSEARMRASREKDMAEFKTECETYKARAMEEVHLMRAAFERDLPAIFKSALEGTGSAEFGIARDDNGGYSIVAGKKGRLN